MKKKNKTFICGVLFLGLLVLPIFGLAENCPNLTTVEGTNVNFVGELTDMGGDTTTAVWFEYGQTSNYGQKTIEKTLTQPSTYCIAVSGLSPCTTYHYRAVARNNAGISYGEDKTFTTTCKKEVSVNKLVRNLSDGTSWQDSVTADPGEILSFLIQVKNGSSLIENVIVKDNLPSNIRFIGELKIDETPVSGDIISGLNIGNLSPNQTKNITFKAEVADSSQFAFGETNLVNSASVLDFSDTATVVVKKAKVLGATSISTGLTDNFLLDFFVLPLIVTFIVVYLFKSHIIKWEEWLDKRKKEYKDYKARKTLQFKIAKIKTKEILRKI